MKLLKDIKNFHVHHKNDNKDDNRSDNLQILTTKEHSLKTKKKSCKKRQSKPIKCQHKITGEWKSFSSLTDAAEFLQCDYGAITDVLSIKRNRKSIGTWFNFQYIPFKNLPGEIWKNLKDNKYIKNNFGIAEISNLGRVKTNKGVKSYGCLRQDGYYYVHILGKSYLISRLVAVCFLNAEIDKIGIPFKKLDVDHIDDNSKNNKLENLQVLTKKKHSEKTKSRPNRKSSALARSKAIRGKKKNETEWIKFTSASHAARELNLTLRHIQGVLKGRRKTHGGYIFEYIKQLDLKNEEWKLIKELGIKVSNLGRIETYSGIKTYGTKHPSGYRYIGINSKQYRVHRLICLAFNT